MEAKGLLKRAGLKATPQRIALLEEILKVAGKEHPSADELYEKIRGRIEGISLTTVYRNLTSLERAGLISRVPTLSDKVRYDAIVRPHAHFICLKCGKIEDLKVKTPKVEVKDKPGRVISCSLVCYGFCKECSEQ